jgi:hypothetical protein
MHHWLNFRQAYPRVDRWAPIVLIAATMTLAIFAFVKNFELTSQLNRSAVAECVSRRHNVAVTNKHELVPLKAELAYIAQIGFASAAAQKDPARKAAALVFARRFQEYAGAVRSLPKPKC